MFVIDAKCTSCGARVEFHVFAPFTPMMGPYDPGVSPKPYPAHACPPRKDAPAMEESPKR